jgi:hypothetical protein
MKIVKFAIVAALTSTCLTTPAAANPPIFDTTGLTPQEVCELHLNPSEHSGFTTYPGTVVAGEWTNDGPLVIGAAIGDVEPTGTPIYSNVFLSNSYFRNGGSPNVWALAQATITYPGSQQLHETEQPVVRTDTFDCIVEKTVGNGDEKFPPGLQSVGNTAVEHDVITGQTYVPSNEPYVIEGATVKALICISPNNTTKGKAGTWTGKNGFNPANCPTASITAGGTVPSGNAPNI